LDSRACSTPYSNSRHDSRLSALRVCGLNWSFSCNSCRSASASDRAAAASVASSSLS